MLLHITGISCFGPTQAAARIESSKAFAKAFMDRHGIPTARWKSFTDAQQAKAFLRRSLYTTKVLSRCHYVTFQQIDTLVFGL